MPEFDARLTAARDDIAAAHLKDVVRAPRYVDGKVLVADHGVVPLRAKPSATSRLETQVFFGEQFTAYDEADGWAWGQCAFDGYVGYVERRLMGAPHGAATYRVSALFSHIYAAGEVKAPALGRLPMNAKLSD